MQQEHNALKKSSGKISIDVYQAGRHQMAAAFARNLGVRDCKIQPMW
jgi:hypothetical protein